MDFRPAALCYRVGPRDRSVPPRFLAGGLLRRALIYAMPCAHWLGLFVPAPGVDKRLSAILFADAMVELRIVALDVAERVDSPLPRTLCCERLRRPAPTIISYLPERNSEFGL